MKKFFFVLALAAGLPLAGCTKSVEKAERDVQRAHDQAVTNIERKQQDLEETKRDAADRIARKEERLQDTARQETNRIKKEERALDDAVRADARRHETTTETTPRTETNAPDVTPTVP